MQLTSLLIDRLVDRCSDSCCGRDGKVWAVVFQELDSLFDDVSMKGKGLFTLNHSLMCYWSFAPLSSVHWKLQNCEIVLFTQLLCCFCLLLLTMTSRRDTDPGGRGNSVDQYWINCNVNIPVFSSIEVFLYKTFC